ncbi:MAG: glycosyltransferase family protein [Pseudomonadota bacterium]
MSTIAIIQARTGSSRLPGKILKTLAGDSVISQVYHRVAQAKGLDSVVIAMPEGAADDALADHVATFCPMMFRGSETDVLARYAGAATLYPADTYVRITSDCPFIDPDILDAMLGAFSDLAPDYMTNTLVPHLPRGLDVEVFTAAALQTAADEATAPHLREHVTPFLYQNADRFDICGFRALPDDHSALRWTLDTPEDWELISRMSDMLDVPLQQARLRDFLDLYQSDPELHLINAAIQQKPLDA